MMFFSIMQRSFPFIVIHPCVAFLPSVSRFSWYARDVDPRPFLCTGQELVHEWSAAELGCSPLVFRSWLRARQHPRLRVCVSPRRYAVLDTRSSRRSGGRDPSNEIKLAAKALDYPYLPTSVVVEGTPISFSDSGRKQERCSTSCRVLRACTFCVSPGVRTSTEFFSSGSK